MSQVLSIRTQCGDVWEAPSTTGSALDPLGSATDTKCFIFPFICINYAYINEIPQTINSSLPSFKAPSCKMRSPEPITHLGTKLDLSKGSIRSYGQGFQILHHKDKCSPHIEHFFVVNGALGMQDIFLYFGSLNINQIKGFQAEMASLFYKPTYLWNLCSSELSTC